MNKKIILVSGDPNSVNSEIIFKCWKKIPRVIKKNLVLISNLKLINDQFKKLNYKVKLRKIKNYDEKAPSNSLKILDIDLNYKNPFHVSKKSSSKFVIKSLNLAHELGLKSKVAGIINCPIDKNLLKKKKIGVTEYLASKCSIKPDNEVMVIANKKLMVSPITTHVDIKSVSKLITLKKITTKIKILNKWYSDQFNKKPKIAILGLNPHNSELIKESKKKINFTSNKKLKKINIKIDGPYAADSFFINKYKKFNIIIGMYHDQVLTPYKTLFKFDAINLTLGLKYIRVSPDHGVAKDKIMKKQSNFLSLLNCMHFIHKLNL